MSDFYEPYGRLITIVILGRVFQVPENNLLLRQMQYAAPDIGAGRYCWNGECRYCEIEYARGQGGSQPALACRMKGVEGMRITKAAAEIRYNMGSAMAEAPRAKE